VEYGFSFLKIKIERICPELDPQKDKNRKTCEKSFSMNLSLILILEREITIMMF